MPGYKHNNLTVSKINPEAGDKFSPRLHAYLKKAGPQTRIMQVYRDLDKGLWIGFFDEGCFIGARLSLVLCEGGKTKRGAFTGGWTKDLFEVQDFWENYMKVGRCAIDPEHETSFLDETRWKVDGKTRHCLWCGNATQHLESYEVRETKTRWVNISHGK